MNVNGYGQLVIKEKEKIGYERKIKQKRKRNIFFLPDSNGNWQQQNVKHFMYNTIVNSHTNNI